MAHTKSQIEHNAHLNVETAPSPQRATRIVCTIGPASKEVETLKQLIENGMNVVRMNFSHGEHSYHKQVMENARQASKELGNRIVAIALDTKGPEIRTGKTANGGNVTLQEGTTVRVTTDPAYNEKTDETTVWVDYSNLPQVVVKDHRIFIDDGLVALQVTNVDPNKVWVDTVVLNSGVISDRKGVNLPDTNVDLPAVSVKDSGDLKFGVENNVDMVFASFVRKRADVKELRKHLESAGPHGKKVMIISKIENLEGVRNFSEILDESDGVMVARGDLGIEIPAQKVFVAQKMMISQCNLVGKPVICATQMLESMVVNPRPTRAEVSDVANAVLDGADCVMLSGETAKGKHPLEAVSIMSEISREAERVIQLQLTSNNIRSLNPPPVSREESVATSAVNAAYEIKARAILVLTNSGRTARLVAKYRPRCPVIAITKTPTTARQLCITHGVRTVLYQGDDVATVTMDQRLYIGVEQAKSMGILSEGDIYVAVHADKIGKGFANLTRVMTVE